MNCSFIGSGLSNASPFPRSISHHKPHQRKYPALLQSISACSCRASSSTSGNDGSAANNLYKVLALNSKEASVDEIKRAYRALARRYHPDACHDPCMKQERTRMFVELHAAYETLSDPVLRQEYDCRLSSHQGAFMARGYGVSIDPNCSRARWQEQIQELKRRSNYRMARKKGGSIGGSQIN